MHIRTCLLTAALLVMMTIAATAQAQTYTVGVENIDYYPLYSWNGKEYRGYVRELLDTFAKTKGYTFQYKALPLKRLYRDFFNGEVDMKFPDNSMWAADQRKGKNITYSSPVLDYIDGVMVLPANKGKLGGKLKTLGLIAGFTAWEYFGDIKSGKVKTDENSNYSSLLEKTMRGRVDGSYSNVAVANYQMNEILHQPGGLVFDESLPHNKSSYFLSSIKHKGVIDEFNAFLAANQDLVAKLKAKYKTQSY